MISVTYNPKKLQIAAGVHFIDFHVYDTFARLLQCMIVLQEFNR